MRQAGVARRRLGPVLVTVANASGPQGTVAVDDLSWEYMLGHLEFFARSPLLLLHAALPDMRAAGWGRVVHIGSDMFDRGEPGWSAYMAAKGALVGLTRGWRRAQAPQPAGEPPIRSDEICCW